MKNEQREYLLRMAALFATHAEKYGGDNTPLEGMEGDNCLMVTPELCAVWAHALVAIVDDNTPKIILPGG